MAESLHEPGRHRWGRRSPCRPDGSSSPPPLRFSRADEALASSYVAWATGLVRNPPAESEPAYLATFADAGSAWARRCGADWADSGSARAIPKAAIAFAEDVFAQRAEAAQALQGVVGTMAACEAFARKWHALCGRPHALRVQLRNHKLTRVEPVPQPPGAARVATADDIGWVSAAQHEFIAEIQLPEDPERLRKLVPRRIGNGAILDLGRRRRGRVCRLDRCASRRRARCAGVYATPHLRGRGYAHGTRRGVVAGVAGRRPPAALPDHRPRESRIEFDLRQDRLTSRSRIFSTSISSTRRNERRQAVPSARDRRRLWGAAQRYVAYAAKRGGPVALRRDSTAPADPSPATWAPTMSCRLRPRITHCACCGWRSGTA